MFKKILLSFLVCIAFIAGTYQDETTVAGDLSPEEISRIEAEMRFKEEYNSRVEFVSTIARFYNPTVGDSVIATVVDMSYKYPELEVELICAVITHESGKTWSSTSLSPVGAIGLMQIMPKTGEWLCLKSGRDYTDELLNNPCVNVQLGCAYLDELVSSYGIPAGLAGYNGGPRRAKMYSRGDYSSLPSETSAYVPKILALM